LVDEVIPPLPPTRYQIAQIADTEARRGLGDTEEETLCLVLAALGKIRVRNREAFAAGLRYWAAANAKGA
jgi:hypothetical protein